MYEFRKEKKKSTCNKFHEQKKTVSTQKNPRLKKYACSMFHEQNWFQEEKKNQCTCFTKRKNQPATSFTNKKTASNKFHEPKTIRKQQLPLTKSVSRGEKSMYKFREENKQNHTATRFTNKRSSLNKFHEHKSACNKFHEQNQFSQ